MLELEVEFLVPVALGTPLPVGVLAAVPAGLKGEFWGGKGIAGPALVKPGRKGRIAASGGRRVVNTMLE